MLEPAAEVAGSMIHPTIGWSVARLLAHLNQSAPYVAMTGPIAAGKTRLAERLAGEIAGAADLGAARLVAARRLLRRPGWSAWATELEFLAERTRLLAEKGVSPLFASTIRTVPEIGTVPFFPAWAVSDFWFDQSAAFARAWLPAEQLRRFLSDTSDCARRSSGRG